MDFKGCFSIVLVRKNFEKTLCLILARIIGKNDQKNRVEVTDFLHSNSGFNSQNVACLGIKILHSPRLTYLEFWLIAIGYVGFFDAESFRKFGFFKYSYRGF